ncbi:MAG TPA: hypothetical protein VMT51_00225 [Dongiaceae bacterium]|nr:hypothetical protein [Dongiaceae bacterium]
MSDWNPQWVEALSATDAQQRGEAARQIYRAGRSRADAAVHAWWQNPEFAALCGGEPHVTVGLAVRPETFARIRQAHGQPPLAQVPPDQDAREFELHFSGGVALDVLTSRDPEASGAIARFLAKQGEGVQQVEFLCSNVDQATQILRDQFGVEPIYPQTRAGANGTRINFFLVVAPSGHKVLVELYENPSGV